MIELNGVAKTFDGTVHALQDVTYLLSKVANSFNLNWLAAVFNRINDAAHFILKIVNVGANILTATLTFCVLMNGAMVMGLAPVVGVPMPLLSWGGTVMMSMMIGFGLIMAVRVQRYAEISSGKGSVL